MKNLDKEKQDLLSAIHDLGYESLRYSIFNEYGPGEWEVVIEYDDFKQVYNVYATMDRASKGGIFNFTDFSEAKERFLKLLGDTIFFNRYYVQEGMGKMYSSPLWDGSETLSREIIENYKRIIEKSISEKNYQSLVYVLFNEKDTTPFAIHLFFRDNLFMVNCRDDRSYIMGKTFEFTNFLEAKEKFFKLLDFTVREGRRDVANSGSYMYPSPLWDKEEID